MRRLLNQKFYARPTTQVARELLGKFLVRRIGRREVSAMITEVEAYDGLRDKASHAFRGRTPRTAVMFGPAGVWYVYFTYGMHWMLNVVSGKDNYPAAVLIRGVVGVNGPGRVTKYFQIDKTLNGRPADSKSSLWIEDRGALSGMHEIKKGPRIGVDYAGPYWAGRHLRLYLAPRRPGKRHPADKKKKSRD